MECFFVDSTVETTKNLRTFSCRNNNDCLLNDTLSNPRSTLTSV